MNNEQGTANSEQVINSEQVTAGVELPKGIKRVHFRMNEKIYRRIRVYAMQQDSTFEHVLNQACIEWLKWVRLAERDIRVGEELQKTEEELAVIQKIIDELETKKKRYKKKGKQKK